jgi:hypothetical protein
LYDYQLRADILTKTGASDDDIISTYINAAKIDTSLNLKVDLLKKGTAYFKEQKKRRFEATLIEKIIALKSKPSLTDYFDLTMAHYFTPDHAKSRTSALYMRDNWVDQMYGYEWSVNSSRILDSVKKDSIYVPDLLKMETFAFTDTVKYKKQYLNSVRSLSDYYYNTARNKEKSIEYFSKWLAADAANAESVKKYLEMAQSMGAQTPPTKPGTKPATQPRTGSGAAPKTSSTPPAGTKTPVKKPATTKAVAKN